MASGPITLWQIDGETVKTVTDFIFWGSKVTADCDCSHEIKRRLLLGRKVMTNRDQIRSDQSLSHVRLLATPWTAAHQAPDGIFQARVLEWVAIAFSIALTRWTFVGKVMSLLFNMLSSFVITFLPRCKRLSISWLQSPSAVILEPQKIKSVIVSTISPSICHEVMGPDAMILVF